ncbi:putative MAPEG superfamily protein [Roseiarcus fermentans]|uniref:Putative MAPEG superfamily protein n=1 Tax=Roseiarcus fermentans TaxID=1473586 RepID=A0A366ELI7_9HYPH|nr:MAPEG family protein [Roseiarcus fermentans]RBP02305.1 putative MAPEG superfamily protein [Roseiarcus fermentans]
MSELACLELSVLLWVVHVVAQAGAANLALPRSYLVSARDVAIEPKGVIAGRARRALANYLESFTAFVALDLAFIALHWSAGIWPIVWIVARVAYLPLYLFNVAWVRSLVWGVSVLAIVMMLLRLALD